MAALDLKRLRYALAVADNGGVRRAATALGLPKSVLSAQLRALEDEVGVTLFERAASGTRPTQHGRTLIRSVRRHLEGLEEAVSAAAAVGRGEVGVLGIGIFESVSAGFPRDLVREFAARHRDVVMRFADGKVARHFRRVRERELDLAFVLSVEGWTGDQELFWSERAFVALPDAHALAGANTVRLEDLRHEAFIVQRSEPEIRDYIERYIRPDAAAFDLTVHDVGRENLLALVGLGFGATLLAESMVGVQIPGVRYVEITDERIDVYGVWLRENPNPLLCRFLAHTRAERRRADAVRARR